MVTASWESSEAVGPQIKGRRTRLGMSVKALVERANVNRASLTAIEAGASVQDRTVGKVVATLDALD